MTSVESGVDVSAEVAWYLDDRGIGPVTAAGPKWATPEPNEADGAVFDPERVDRVLKAFHHLVHTQGQWADQPLDPDPWQVAYILAPVFGWVRWDEEAGDYTRIINQLLVDEPRKSGKSTLMGGLAVYMAFGDREPGAQVVTAATNERQAGFVFNPIKQLAQRSPALSKYVHAHQKKIVNPTTGSYIEVVSSAASAQHGANLHCGIVDELHLHQSADLVEALETGTGSRRQPLLAMITTADSGAPGTIYARKRDRLEQLARGAITDETFYGVVWAADEADDPFAEDTWRKANPGFGVSPTRAYLQRAAAEAKQSPADLAKFQRLHLGVRTKQEARYVELDEWDRNAGRVDESRLMGRIAYGGLDLGSTSDLTSLCWVFPDERGGFDCLWRVWAPEESLPALDKRTAGLASVWRRDGMLTVTDGNVTDYEAVKDAVLLDLERFRVAELGFDPWNATDLTNRLQAEEAPMVNVRQGYATLSPALKEIKRLLAEGSAEAPRLRHGGNPLVRWMIDNLTVSMDPSGNVKPDKARAADKIDAVSALTTAMARGMHHKPPKRSAYEDAALEVI